MGIIRTSLALIGAVIGMVVIVPICLIVAPIWAVGWVSRTLAGLCEPNRVPWQEVIEFHPDVGWKPKANLDTHCSVSERAIFHLTTDPQGWRGGRSIEECEIIVFGDSYAFGFGVDDKALFSNLNSQLRIKGVGAPGYSMVHDLLWMRQLSSKLRGKLLVWFIYVGNDLYDNLVPNLYNYRMPFVRRVNGSDNWEIVVDHISPTTWPFNFERNPRVKDKWAATFGPEGVSGRTYSACEFLIGQAHKTCTEAGAELVVMTIPWPGQLSRHDWEKSMSRVGDLKSFNPHLPDQKIKGICENVGVPFVAGIDYLQLQDHIKGEGHWNERGHKRVREVLERLYCRYTLVGSGVAK